MKTYNEYKSDLSKTQCYKIPKFINRPQEDDKIFYFLLRKLKK